MKEADFIGSSSIFRTEDSIKREVKRFLGGLIWITQTRYDLSFLVTLLTTSLPMAAQEHRFLPHFLKLRAVAVRSMNDRSLTVWYHPFSSSRSKYLMKPQLIAFADAGFANLPNSSSTESYFIAYGRPLTRDGVITCEIHPMLWGTRKLRRVARSSLTAEVVALCTTIDTCYWFQALLHETFFGKFLLDSFDPDKPSPLFAPFPAPVGSSSASNRTIFLSSTAAAQFDSSEIISSLVLLSSVSPERAPVSISFSLIRHVYDSFFVRKDRVDSESIPILILTDSANAFSSSHGGNPRSIDRHTRIHMCYIRDGLDRYNLSFCSAGFNLADCGTKLKGQVSLVETAFRDNRCRIGFLSRSEMQMLKQTLAAGARDLDKFTGYS